MSVNDITLSLLIEHLQWGQQWIDRTRQDEMQELVYHGVLEVEERFADGNRGYEWFVLRFDKDFYAHLKVCGLDGLGFTFRSLRHSFVTHRLDRDVPIHVVKDLAGHKRIDTTAVYAHASASGKRIGIENSPLAEVK